jgi:hypothetical protein
MPKAGSSSLQRTLRLNRKLLRKSGVFYPHHSNFLYSLATGEGSEPPPIIPPGSSIGIFSDERLLHRVRDEAEASRIADALRAYSDDITIVCYVRREDEVFVSSYYTLLLMGSSLTLAERPLVPMKTYKRLRAWDSAFGRSHIVLRRFGPAYLKDGIVPDFLALAGLDGIGIVEANRTNVSPRTDVLEMIRRINELHDETDRFALKEIAAVGGKGERVGLSAEKRRALVEMARDGTSKLSRFYLKGEPLFTHPFPDDERSAPELSASDVAEVGKQIAAIHGMDAAAAPTDLTESLRWLYGLALSSTQLNA